jgi:nocturnin
LAHNESKTSFIKCPIPVLRWDYRAPRLVEEILRSSADIVCLEEVDHFEDFFKPVLSKHGFEGFFLPKVGSPCLEFPNNNGPDGCAMFYQADQFELLKKKDIVLRNVEGGDSHQVALLAEFQRKQDNSPPVVVAMAHFKAKSESVALRAAQGKHLVQEAIKFSATGQPVIIAGDFNATNQEDAYKHVSDNASHPELKLESSYKVLHNNEEPPFTSWKFRAKGEAKYTIDYIWYTPETLCVEGVWGVPAEGAIGKDALPCSVYPSDHVALCTNFSFRK